MPFSTTQALEPYRRMERIRRFEEALQELYLGGGYCGC